MMTQYLIFGISISFISWLVGIFLHSILIKTAYYKKLSNLNFIPSKMLNKAIGISYFKWIVKNTFFKYFNQKILLENQQADLTDIRAEMTVAELGHLIGFAFVSVVALYKGISEGYVIALVIMIVNVVMNLYPSLLQQENKRRLDLLLKRQMKVNVRAN